MFHSAAIRISFATIHTLRKYLEKENIDFKISIERDYMLVKFWIHLSQQSKFQMDLIFWKWDFL